MSSQFGIKVLGYTIPMDYVLIIGVTALFIITIYKLIVDSAKRTNVIRD